MLEMQKDALELAIKSGKWRLMREAQIPPDQEPDESTGWFAGRPVVLVAQTDENRVWAYDDGDNGEGCDLLVAADPTFAPVWIVEALDACFETIPDDACGTHVVRIA